MRKLFETSEFTVIVRKLKQILFESEVYPNIRGKAAFVLQIRVEVLLLNLII